MKKTLLVSSIAAALLLASLLTVGCTQKNGGDTTTTETTTTFDQTHEKPSTEIPDLKFQKNLDKLTEVEAPKASETVEKIGYTVQTTDEGWSINEGVDLSVYDYVGNGNGLVEAAKEKYPKRTISYYKYDVENQKRTKITESRLQKMGSVLAFYTYDSKTKIAGIYIQEMDLRIRPEYKSINGQAGYFLTVSFDTNMPSQFSACISSRKGDTGGVIKHSGINTTGKDGKYKATAKLTIPYVTAGDYYLNIAVNDGVCLASIPVKISDSEFTKNTYHLQYIGDWDLIKDPNYQTTLTNLFYNTYARLYARWGTGSEPKTITFVADPNYDGVAYCQGTKVVVSLDYANGNPKNFGFFSHEITHSVQQYNFAYGNNAWWTENMANYGGFRYYHWSSAESIQLWKDANQSDLYEWINDAGQGYEPYGDGSKWFFAYLDDHWPTTKNEDGSLKYGLIDTINKEIKNGRLRGGDDNPFDKTNTFNKIVKEVTGFDCIDDIRKQYATEFKSGEWEFVGFANYRDNFLTENLKDAPNPNYPMVSDPVHGDKTAQKLDTVVSNKETNLCMGASIYRCAGQIKDSESAQMLIDGYGTTKWCINSAKDKEFCLDGTQYWVIIDLGEKKDFNTYTIFNCKSMEKAFPNMSEWEIFVSDDAESWVSVDYQTQDGGDKVSYNIGDQSARYVFIRIYNAGNYGTLRLYEFQLYNIEE